MALVHAIDWELWRDAPAEWERRMWVTREELSVEPGSLLRGKTVAAEYSPRSAIPYLYSVPDGMDDTEAYDDRLLISGVGISVEPRIYLPGETGVRSEVNVFMGETSISVTPRKRRLELLIVGE